MVVHAGDLRDTVELPDLAGEVEAGGAGSEDLVPLGAEAGVGAAALVTGVTCHLGLGALAPPLLLVTFRRVSVEEYSLETLHPGHLPPDPRLGAREQLMLGDLPGMDKLAMSGKGPVEGVFYSTFPPSCCCCSSPSSP